MVVLKFWSNNGVVRLGEKFFMKDITNDERTNMIDRKSFLTQKYRVSENIYMAQSKLFMDMAGKLNTVKIHALHIKEDNNTIIIVPPKNYIFLDGKSVNPPVFSIIGNVNLSKAIKTIMNSPVEHG